ncbi:S-adenosyl-L-methionine dependent methyltransferase, predicted [Purpureocillium lavendulum]|uniref:S-adenosyl-L-methionine dependent methyltransferase, predicted n=1 Tax=Purpureocillium lavendulum TaxID=1247861 RepID=A0AB34FVR5_9HYPO|nr:S-adenosyl-L-methionine dependent methyltransferase, predicted [Purpureocillium lavendulum]
MAEILPAMGPKRKASVGSGPPIPDKTRPSTCPDVSPGDANAQQAATDRRYRELYTSPPDFKDLSRRDPEFAAVTKGRDLDFNDPQAVKQLTKTLLKLDFGLEIELPDDRLCPPVPNRHNYILWLKGLLDTSSYSPPGEKVVGLDIGTGASCIYPLLGCTQRPWSFVATGAPLPSSSSRFAPLTVTTDTDAESIAWARKNVQLNDLSSRITVSQRDPSSPLLPLDDLNLASLDFCMTNPPFYASEADMLASAALKSRPPRTACTGSPTEMVTPGGEVGFVFRVVDESLALRGRVRWYTAMLGFLSSVGDVVARLRGAGVDNFAVTEFVQGNKTRRWAVAWSFAPMRPAQGVARGTKAASTKHSILPPPTEFEMRVPLPKDISALVQHVRDALAGLDLMSWEWDGEAMEGTGRAVDRVWARAWRRKKKREAEAKEKGVEQQDVSEPVCVFGFRVQLRVAVDHVDVRCRWVEGFDAVAFESFQGFLKATVEAATAQEKQSK